MTPYGILSPTLGLNVNYPHVFLKDEFTEDCADIFFERGEIWSAKKRSQLFTAVMPHEIINSKHFFKPTTSENWLVVFTRKDVAYRDSANNRFIFLNKIYNTGTLTSAVNSSGGQMTLTFSGTAFLSNVVVGDYIRIVGGSGTPYHTSQTWYPITQIVSNTQLKVTGTVPSGYSIGSGGNGYVIRKTFTGTATDYWSIVVMNEELIATNNGVENIIYWAGTGQLADLPFTGIGTPYKAKRLYVYENRLLLLQPIKSGTLYPFTIDWSSLNNSHLWGGSGSDAGSMKCSEGEGTLTNCATIQGFLYVVKENSIIKAWTVTSTDIFNKKLYINGTGSDAPESFIEKDEKAYFWGSKNVFIEFDGIGPRVISGPLNSIVKNVNPNYQKYIAGTYVEQYNQILWAIPYSTSTTRNKVLIFDQDPEENNWTVLDIPVSSFGTYDQETTYDWATLPFSNWADWSWENWMHREGLSTFPLDLSMTTDGKVCQLNASEQDLGSDFTRYFVLSTDFGKRKKLHLFKRLLQIDVYVKKESTGTLAIGVKRDTEASFQATDGIALTGSEDILIKRLPVDFYAKIFELKFSATTRFRFLGLVCWFDDEGER